MTDFGQFYQVSHIFYRSTESRKRSSELLTESYQPKSCMKTRSQQDVEMTQLRADVISNMTLLISEELSYRISVKEALTSPEGTQSLKAIIGEIRNMIEYHVGHCIHIADLHHSMHRYILPSFMFLVNKYYPNGDFDKVKARLVGGGHRQQSWQYDDISSTTVNITSIFLLLNISSLTKGHLCTYDIKGAFLKREILQYTSE
jgi:hypothetical protein